MNVAATLLNRALVSGQDPRPRLGISTGHAASQTSVDSGLVRAAFSIFNKYELTPSVWPRLAGSAPFYQFTERLKLPLLLGGLGHGSGAHAPNEYMVRPRAGSTVKGLAEIEKGYVDFLFALAGE